MVLLYVLSNLGARWDGWLTSRPGRFTPETNPVPTVQEAGWAPGPLRTGAKNLAPTGCRSPDRPARSELLYRLSYPGPPGNSPSLFVYLQNHSDTTRHDTTQHVPWKPFWSARFGSSSEVNRPHSVYIYIYVAEVLTVWCNGMDVLWDTFHPWEAKLDVSNWAPPDRCGSPARWSNGTGSVLSAELYRRVKQPRSRWVGPTYRLHWFCYVPLHTPIREGCCWHGLCPICRRSLRSKQGTPYVETTSVCPWPNISDWRVGWIFVNIAIKIL